MEADAGTPARSLPGALLQRFTAAESTIYPLALTDPDRYERAVTLVGLVFRRMRADCASLDAVAERLPAAAAEATQLAEAHEVSLAGLDPAAIADAAAALRCRELLSGGAATT